MAVTTDILNRLFSNESGALRAIRTLGLGLVQRTPMAKRFFIGQAAAFSERQPSLLLGGCLEAFRVDDYDGSLSSSNSIIQISELIDNQSFLLIP